MVSFVTTLIRGTEARVQHKTFGGPERRGEGRGWGALRE